MVPRYVLALIGSVVGVGLPLALMAYLAPSRPEAATTRVAYAEEPATCGTWAASELRDCSPPTVSLDARSNLTVNRASLGPVSLVDPDELARRLEVAWRTTHSEWCLGCDGMIDVKAPATFDYGHMRPVLRYVHHMDGVQSIRLAIDKDATQ